MRFNGCIQLTGGFAGHHATKGTTDSETGSSVICATPLLDQIESPADLKKLSVPELTILASEIRDELITVIARNGGHLAPNLGAVELTIALHYVFDTPKDTLIWDVGHQGYVHKLLTGRRIPFRNLRKENGCPGFLSRAESKYDAFGGGHAGTAISAALGFAVARDRRGGHEKVVAIVGDGSLNCGISLEGLNNAAETSKDFIVVLNDNRMSISPNVGAIPRYLNNLISGRSYNRFKALAKTMLRKVPHGEDIRKGISRFEEATKSLFLPGVFFEEMGLRYLGPIDGHDLPDLISKLSAVKEFKRPALVHVITEKGHGYPFAETAPEKFHGTAAFDPKTGLCSDPGIRGAFSKVFGSTLCELAGSDERIVAVTAAMTSGTGLAEFAKRYPDRFHDVGIAEEHAVVFAAGLAAAGLKPVVAIYSTFLQRALDCIFHDICLQNLPVVIATDRSGVVEDGPTHHGIYDTAFLRCLPNLAILWPKHEIELRDMLAAALRQDTPVIVKYAKCGLGLDVASGADPDAIPWGKSEIVRNGSDLAIWALGMETQTALEVADILFDEHRISSAVVNTRFLVPFDGETLRSMAENVPIVTIEDGQTGGGLGCTVDETLVNSPHRSVLHFGWKRDSIPPHGTVESIRERSGLSAAKIAALIAANQNMFVHSR